jgi:putative ABC transport system permease protein
MAGVSGRKLGRRITTRWPILFAISEAVSLGFQAIRAYKMRAGLTILGVVMGIMTVTGMSSIVAGLNRSMARQIESLGSSVVFVRPWGPGDNMTPEEFRRRKGLVPPEVELIASRPAVRYIAPLEVVSTSMIKAGSEKLQNVQVIGTTPAYEQVHDLYVEKGRFISETEVDRGSKVAVLGAEVADALFPFVEPVGKDLFIDGRRFEVIGVSQRMGKFLFINRDNFILVPLGCLQKRDPRFNFLIANVKPVSPERMEDAIEETREVLRRYRKLKYLERDNFTIFSQETFTDLYRQLTGGIYVVMIAISSIGLVVGGVGVMNIMLVSVTERTREIGVRKALGAKRRDILWQFLTEAMTLTAVGGILGILIGGGLAFLINAFSPFPAVVQPTWVLVAFAVSVGVGLTFGLWPAAKAARLDPIEALRYE